MEAEGSLTHTHTDTMWNSSQSQFGQAGTGKQRIRKDYLWGGGVVCEAYCAVSHNRTGLGPTGRHHHLSVSVCLYVQLPVSLSQV